MPVLYDANNVIVGEAQVYVQPWVLAVPAVLPANTVALGATWSGPWVATGATDQGWQLKNSTKTSEIMIEEQSTPVAVKADGKTVSLGGSLAEDTLQSMVWAYGGGTLQVVAPASGVPGSTTLSLQDELAIWAVGLEVTNKFGLARRILIPKAVAVSDTETAFRRAADKRMYALEFNSICKPSEIKIVDITAEALP